MTRPRRRSRTTPSLFPFLSVIACIIGALTLILAASAVGQMATGAIDLERYERLEEEIVVGRRQLAELRSIASEVQELEGAIEGERKTQRELAEQLSLVAAGRDDSAPLEAELADAESRVARLEIELREADASRDGLEQRLAERREALARAPILVEPSGSGYGLEPHFIECREDGIVLYEGEGAIRKRRYIPLRRIQTSPDPRRFLRRVRSREGATAIFLVRPGGVEACRAVQSVERAVRNGSLPIPAEGEIRFAPVRERG